MDNSLVTAIITGVVAIVSPILTLIVKDRLERRQSIFKAQPLARRKAISGSWAGTVYQTEGPAGPPIKFDIELDLSTDGIKVGGKGFFEWDGRPTELQISGGYVDDSYLKLEYKDADYTILRYGTIFFQISPDARNLVGRFLGYAAERGGLIYGEVKMAKMERRFKLAGG
jgi:hypothetical protein